MVTDTSQPTYARPSLQRAHDDPADPAVPPSTAALPGAHGPRRRRAGHRGLPARLSGRAPGLLPPRLAACAPPSVPARAGRPRRARRTWQSSRAESYVRSLIDVLLLSAGLSFAGGTAAAHFVGVYLIVMIY